MNFTSVKRLFQRIGQAISGNPEDLTEEQRQTDIKWGLRQHKLTHMRETAVKILFFIEILLLLTMFVRQQFI